MEEDDMVMRVGSSLRGRDEPMRRKGCKPEGSIRRCQGLAEGWPWQPPKDPLHFVNNINLIIYGLIAVKNYRILEKAYNTYIK